MYSLSVFFLSFSFPDIVSRKKQCSLSVSAGLSLQSAHQPASVSSHISLLADFSLPSSVLCFLPSPASTSILPVCQRCRCFASLLLLSSGDTAPGHEHQALPAGKLWPCDEWGGSGDPPSEELPLAHHVHLFLPSMAHQYRGTGFLGAGELHNDECLTFPDIPGY